MKKEKYFIIFGSIIILVLGLYFFQFNLSGNVVLELEANYSEGENLDGILKLSLNNGEFIPASSIVVFETSDQRYEFALEDVFSEQPIEGTYYIQGQNLSGQGMGYGLMGIKKVYPEISFDFNVYSKSKVIKEKKDIGEESVSGEVEIETETTEIIDNVGEAETETEVVEEEVVEEEVVEEEVVEEEVVEEEVVEEEVVEEEVVEEEVVETETSEVIDVPIESEEVEITKEEAKEDKKEAKEDKKEAKEDKESKEKVVEEPTITGGVISSLYERFASLFWFTTTGQVSLSFETIISGKTSANEPFVYNLEKAQTAELVSGSVTDGSIALSDDDIQFEVLKDRILVSTDYFELEEGFGINYLESDFQTFEINLSTIGLNFSKGDLNIRFVYEEEEVISLSIVLQEGKIKGRNESVLIEVPEFILQNLTDDERQILVQEFGNISIKTTRAEVLDGRLIRNYKIGDYELVASYDYDLNVTDSLKEQMEKDKLNFLRDLIKMISEEENGSENVLEFFGNSDF